MIEIAVVAAIVYFVVFGAGFLVRPELVDRFGLRYDRPAGRVEVRCYYGALSWGLAGFLGWLLAHDQARHALVGVLFLASAVLLARMVSTIADDARDDPYTRLAIPTETIFVFALAVVLAASG